MSDIANQGGTNQGAANQDAAIQGAPHDEASKNYRLHDMQSLTHLHLTPEKGVQVDDEIEPYETKSRKAAEPVVEQPPEKAEIQEPTRWVKQHVVPAVTQQAEMARGKITAKPLTAGLMLFSAGWLLAKMGRSSKN
jgi:hypothetical protein